MNPRCSATFGHSAGWAPRVPLGLHRGRLGDAASVGGQGVPANTRWQAEIAPMFEVRAQLDTTLERLEEIFHLD